MQITTLDDPRVAPYRNVRERNLRAEGLFIAEGTLLAERLLGSRFEVESLFTTEENAARFAQLLQNSQHPQTSLYIAPAVLMREIVGFDFHRGVLAIGRRVPFATTQELVSQALEQIGERVHFLACPATETSENLGLLLRSASAFGLSGVLLANNGADPLSRRCLRQSMGSALNLPFATSENLLDDLGALRQAHGFSLIGAVADDENAVSLGHFQFPQRAVLILGNEYQGLDTKWLAACDFHVTIPLAPGCDSLNVAVAAGIFFHQMHAKK